MQNNSSVLYFHLGWQSLCEGVNKLLMRYCHYVLTFFALTFELGILVELKKSTFESHTDIIVLNFLEAMVEFEK